MLGSHRGHGENKVGKGKRSVRFGESAVFGNSVRGDPKDKEVF